MSDLRKLAEAAAPTLRSVDLDIEKRLANHAFAVEWSKAQDESIAALTAENARLKEALRPFAALKVQSMSLRRDDYPVFGQDGAYITAGNIRRAAQEMEGN